jgi:hypothetical protein
LASFASALTDLLHCGPWEERFSSNYPPDEHYFRCFMLGLEIKIFDDDSYDGYDFDLVFKPDIYIETDINWMADLADCVARMLAVQGYTVLRPFAYGQIDSSGIVFKPSLGGRVQWEQTQIDNL